MYIPETAEPREADHAGKELPNMRRKDKLSMKRRILCVFLALFLVIPLVAAAEEEYWICPECLHGGNRQNFCTNCGAARPISEGNDNITKIPGETDRVSVDVQRIDGSGFVAGKKDKYLYEPAKVLDLDPATCWMFSTKNADKDKVWLGMIIEEATIDEIWIRNGFQADNGKGKDQYPLYARAKDIVVVFSYNEKESDSMTFTLTDDSSRDWQKLDTGRLEGVGDVLIYFQSFYKGKSKPNIACLSEVLLVQKAPAESAKEGYR